ncbi:2Fe-2S ferredoxin [Zhongshania antarctica]|uniref:2Fe-2S ferredoxin n=1 Tax=Zhongshania antarctica TaxID=641702 RepID=A0A840R6Q6_9GAMM|nr:2Fe-2S iron-sulfur cluster-binding protein [Zhongshania antarctica]MBB5188989.1 2Fe-2S ferredoxin [Zhongshania antarctica]
MLKINVIGFDQSKYVIEVEPGTSLMQCIVDEGVPGIDADCGGASACGTCHCFIGDEWIEATGAAGGIEEEMLRMRPDRAKNSRLSCQIDITNELDGLVVNIPEFQM